MSTAFPHLSRPQARVLALWSYGMVLARTCGITQVAAALALQVGGKEASLVQRLREWCYGAADKRGLKRREVDVSTCFAPLLCWIVSRWPSEQPRLALALDATTLKKRFTVLALSVLYRGGAIPVAWKIVGAEAKGSWRPHWVGLLQAVQGSIPAHFTVLVCTDRGRYARWLYEQIQSLGWHPFLRINQQNTFRPLGQTAFRRLATVAPIPGSAWCGRVDCFQERPRRLHCTLLAEWQAGYQEVWLVITDLAPEQAAAAWYGLRWWIEAGFKDCKRGGWQWHQTKMTDPARAERLWLAMAVATCWAVCVGGDAEATLPVSHREALPPTHVARRTAGGRACPRLLSCFARGLLAIVAALLCGDGLRLGQFRPEPWPTSPPAHPTQTTRQAA